MKCEFCGYKLKRTDRHCPNCGGANAAFYDIDNENLENTLDRQEDAIRELQEDVNTYKQKSKKNSTAIIVVVILMIFLVIFPAICCCAINFSIFSNKVNVDTEKDLLDEDYNYEDYEDENELDTDFNQEEFNQYLEDNGVNISDNKLDLGEEIEFTINSKEVTIPMNAGEFINNLEVDFIESYIINAKSDDYVYDEESNISINVYNITDSATEWKDCLVGGIRIHLDDLEDSGINSFEFYGITLNTTPEQAVELFGEPSVYYDETFGIYKEWSTENGWIEFDWTPEGKLNEIAIFNCFGLNDLMY